MHKFPKINGCLCGQRPPQEKSPCFEAKGLAICQEIPRVLWHKKDYYSVRHFSLSWVSWIQSTHGSIPSKPILLLPSQLLSPIRLWFSIFPNKTLNALMFFPFHALRVHRSNNASWPLPTAYVVPKNLPKSVVLYNIPYQVFLWWWFASSSSKSQTGGLLLICSRWKFIQYIRS